jgi:hypothetical protein
MPTAYDLMDAVVAQLRATPAVVTALAEDTSSPSTTKIWADDLATAEPSLPWLTYQETSENLSPESVGPDAAIDYIGSGQFLLTLCTADKLECRQTAYLIVAALNDVPLVFSDGQLLELRHTNPSAPTVPAIGPHSATIYQRVLSFEYIVVRTF